jgi:hypothetical protein
VCVGLVFVGFILPIFNGILFTVEDPFKERTDV